MHKELDHPRKGLINIQNIDDNECFKWCLVRYLNPADHHPEKITKADKDFAKKLDFRDIKFLVKIRDIQKNCQKEFHQHYCFCSEIYVSKKCCEEKHVDLLLIEKERKRHYVFIKDFNTFMYNHTLDPKKTFLLLLSTSFQ